MIHGQHLENNISLKKITHTKKYYAIGYKGAYVIPSSKETSVQHTVLFKYQGAIVEEVWVIIHESLRSDQFIPVNSVKIELQIYCRIHTK